jgi:hypothetical protein
MTSPSIATRYRIRDLNDAFRAGDPSIAGQWLLTAGVSDRGTEFAARAIRQVREFDSFGPRNDPHGEHDFGSFNLAGEHLFWKIDYYDRSFCTGSHNPADPAVTARVLTVMLASEY